MLIVAVKFDNIIYTSSFFKLKKIYKDINILLPFVESLIPKIKPKFYSASLIYFYVFYLFSITLSASAVYFAQEKEPVAKQFQFKKKNRTRMPLIPVLNLNTLQSRNLRRHEY